MLNLVLGRAFTDKTEYLVDRTIEMTERGEKVIFIVPEQFSLSAERLIAKAYKNYDQSRVEVLGFKRLAEKVCKKCGELPRRHADDAGRLIMLLRAYETVSHSLKFYRECGSPAFFEKLLGTYKQLTQSDISPQQLSVLSVAVENRITRHKLYDLGLIFETYEAFCDGGGYETGHELNILAEMLKQYNPLSDYNIVADSFDAFSNQEYLVLRELIGLSRSVTVSLCCDGLLDRYMGYGVLSGVISTGVTLRDIADKRGKKTDITVLNENRRFESDSILKLESALAESGDAKGIEVPLYCAADEHDECEFVACTISKLVRTLGYDYSDFAVVSRRMEDYTGILDTVLSKFDIPYFMDVKSKLKDKPIVLFTHYIFSIAARGFKTSAILGALKTGLTGIDFDNISSLEKYVKYWGINNSQWKSDYKWKYSAGGFEGEKSEKTENITSIKNRFIEPIEKFLNNTQSASALKISSSLYELMDELGVTETLDNTLNSSSETEETQTVLSTFASLLDDINDMLGEEQMSAKDYFRYFETAVGAYSIGRKPTSLNEVITGDIDRIRTYGKKCVFVIGLADGVFPAPPKDCGVLSDYDKVQTEKAGADLNVITSDRIYDEFFLAYKAFTMPTEKLFASYSYAGIDGSIRTPSCFYLQLKKFGGTERLYTDIDELERIERKKPALEKLSVMLKENSALMIALTDYFKDNDDGISINKLKSASDYGVFGNLSPQTAESVFGGSINISPTRMEKFSLCKFMHFVRYILNIDRERTSKFEALDRGNFIHYALSEAVNLLLGEAGNISKADVEEISKISGRIANDYLKDRLSHLEENSRFVYLFGKLKGTLQTIMNELAEEFSQSRFQISATELPIDYSSGVKPVEIALEDSKKLFIRGVIDRVDLYKTGSDVFARVVDYKTGIKDFKLCDVENGLNMQMLIYLFALCENGAGFTGIKAKPAGLLYFPARNPVVSVERDFESGTALLPQVRDLRPNGILLADENVLVAMESKLEGRFIPVKNGKAGIKGNSAITEEKFDLLRRKVNESLWQAGKSMLEGNISVDPLAIGYDACSYCDFSSICGIELGKAQCRRYIKMTDKEFWDENDKDNRG